MGVYRFSIDNLQNITYFQKYSTKAEKSCENYIKGERMGLAECGGQGGFSEKDGGFARSFRGAPHFRGGGDHPRTFSLAHLTAHQCPPPELVEVAAAAGYDLVSLRMTAVTASERVYPLMRDRRMMRDTLSHLAATGLGVLDVELVRLEPDVDPQRYEPFLETAGELGARAVIAQLPDPDRHRAADRYARLCDLAAPYGLAVALEFVSWTETPDLPSAAAVVAAAHRPNGGLLVDILHFARSGSRLADLAALPSNWFHFIHLCDAPLASPSSVEGVIHAARQQRLFPGDGELPIVDIVGSLPEIPCSLEIPNTMLMQEFGPVEFARRALEKAKGCLAGAVCLREGGCGGGGLASPSATMASMY